MPDQFIPAPAPSRAEFNTLSSTVNGLSDRIATIIIKSSKTASTDSAGNILLTTNKIKILSAHCEGYICLPFIHSTGTMVKVLNTGATFSPIASTSVTVTYYYTEYQS